MSFESIRNRIAKLGPRPKGWQRKPTTAENRQELERFLKEIESRPKPSGPPPVLSREEQARSDAIKAELEAMIAETEKRIADDAKWWATPWAERGKL
jgi:hypothetical protein